MAQHLLSTESSPPIRRPPQRVPDKGFEACGIVPSLYPSQTSEPDGEFVQGSQAFWTFRPKGEMEVPLQDGVSTLTPTQLADATGMVHGRATRPANMKTTCHNINTTTFKTMATYECRKRRRRETEECQERKKHKRRIEPKAATQSADKKQVV